MCRWFVIGFVIVAVAGCAKVEGGVDVRSSGPGGAAAPGGSATGGAGGGAPGSESGQPMGTGGSLRGATGAGGASGEAACGLQTFDLVRRPGDVILVLDRSASMQKNSMDKTPTGANDPTKWAQLIPALTDVISQAGGEIAWGLKAFPEDGSECDSATVTTKMDLPVSPMSSATLNQAVMATLPSGNGTPTGAAVGVAADYLNSLQDSNKHYLLLATDGQPSCGGTAGALVKSTSQAKTDAVAAVQAAAAAGIHTFVVGVATKAGDAATLNLLAVAGLEPRSDPDPTAAKYYLGATNSELVGALQAITGVINKDCVFPLSSEPPVPTNIAVKVMGQKAPFDPSNATGWNYRDPRTVEVFGAWCEMIKNDAADKVQIIFGCPEIDIP